MKASSLTALLFTVADSEVVWGVMTASAWALICCAIRGFLPAAALSYSPRSRAPAAEQRANMPISSLVYLSLSLCFISVVVAFPFMSVGLKQSKWMCIGYAFKCNFLIWWIRCNKTYEYKIINSSYMSSQLYIEGFLSSYVYYRKLDTVINVTLFMFHISFIHLLLGEKF